MKTVLALILLAGCATPPRFLTPEQDAAIKAECEANPCAVVPLPWLQRLLQLLGDRTT